MALFKAVILSLNMEYANLLPAICWVESRHKSEISMNDGKSHSYGMCQVKLETANWMKKYYKVPGNKLTAQELMKPRVNIYYAGLYLKYQLSAYSNNIRCAISAYNAGRCIKGNQTTYVKKVLKQLKEFDMAQGIVTVDSHYEVVVPPYERGYVPKWTKHSNSFNLFY